MQRTLASNCLHKHICSYFKINHIMNKQLITTFLFLLVGVYVFGQKDTSELRSQSATECFELSKKDKDYIIKIGNIIYDDEDDIFICKNMIPIDVEIFSKNTMLPVESNLWDWEKCNCAPNLPNNNKAKIDSSQLVKINTKWKLNLLMMVTILH